MGFNAPRDKLPEVEKVVFQAHPLRHLHIANPRRGPWRGLDDVELATLEWVDWFNHRRLYEYCGDIPPVEAEALYYARNQAQQQLEPSNQ